MYMPSQLDCYYAPYPLYSTGGVEYNPMPSPSTSGSESSSSPSPQDHHSFSINYAFQQSYDQNYLIPPQYIQIPKLHSHPIYAYPTPPPSYADPLDSCVSTKPRPGKITTPSRPIQISHPYARLFAKKDEVKRRKIWNHALEKSIFSPYELSTVGAPQRRTLYIASLEAHIDRLHSRLLELGFWPIDFGELEPFKGLNSKTAKSMVSGLQHDASLSNLKVLELERANSDLEEHLSRFIPTS